MAVAEKVARQAKVRSLPAVRNVPLMLAMALVAVGLAGILPLLLNTNATTTSFTIRDLEDERAHWQARNVQLQNEIASLSSLPYVEREAMARLGMMPAASEQPKLAVMLEAAPEPDNPYTAQVPNRFLPPMPDERKPSTSWWRSLLDLLPVP